MLIELILLKIIIILLVHMKNTHDYECKLFIQLFITIFSFTVIKLYLPTVTDLERITDCSKTDLLLFHLLYVLLSIVEMFSAFICAFLHRIKSKQEHKYTHKLLGPGN